MRIVAYDLLSSTDKDVVDEFCRICGGVVYGPYKQRHNNGKPYYQWHDTGEENIRHVLDLISPYMMSRRKDRIEECIRLRDERRTMIPENRCKKLSLAERGEIINRVTNGEKRSNLAREFNVSPSMITFYMKGL